MSDSFRAQGMVPAARALTAALTSLGDALAQGDPTGVLAAEPPLTTALAAITSSRSSVAFPALDSDQSAALADELTAARAALTRCAALGASLDEIVRAGGCGTAGYDVAGAGIHERLRPAFDQSM